MQTVPKIVITGGPCAGKTTVLARARSMLIERGFNPVVVPEAATIYITAGLDPRKPEFQRTVLAHVLNLEREIEENARATLEKPVLLCDRGIFDQNGTYMPKDGFRKLLESMGLVFEEELQRRYLAAMFLHSAAEGAEEFYSNASNQTRYEPLEEARALNQRTLDAWVGIPHLVPVENRPGKTFEDKILYALKTISHVLGVPEPLEIERKFLLREFDPAALPAHTSASEIVQHYLVRRGDGMERVRARSQNNVPTFYHTIKRRHSGSAGNIEVERIITEKEYNALLLLRDPDRRPIIKTRNCFVHGSHYCELDVFRGHREGLAMLEIEVVSEEEKIDLPPFLTIEREVTNDPDFTNRSLAEVVS